MARATLVRCVQGATMLALAAALFAITVPAVAIAGHGHHHGRHHKGHHRPHRQAVAGPLRDADVKKVNAPPVHGKGGGVAQKVDQGKAVPAPKLDLPRLDTSGRLTLASLRGKVVVVNFWESYCVPCKEEARDVAAAARAWSGKDVVFVGVDAQDFRGAAKRFVSRYGVDYPIVRDGRGSTLGHWGITGFPETFLVDRRGRIRPPHVSGPVDRGELDAAIQRALTS